MSLTLLLRGGTAADPLTIFDNGQLVPLDARTKSIVNGISPLIESQVPDFTNLDHPNFVAFIEAYYEFMEQQGNATERTLLLNDFYDIENTLDEFVDSFEHKFMKNFPKESSIDSDGNLLDRKTLLKRVRDFYAIKGSESSFAFFFDAFYNSIAEVFYPKTDILETSTGKWIERKSIRVTSENGLSNFTMKNKSLVQLALDESTTNATAFISDIIQYDLPPFIVTELFLENIDGDFIPNRTIEVELSDGSKLREKTFGLLSEYTISNSGVGYAIGDFVKLVEEGGGIGAAAKVTRVDNRGRIKDIEILNHGVNYFTDVTFTIESTTGNGNAQGTAKSSALAEYDGFYYDNSGKLSSKKKLEDNDYYQYFSYVLKTKLSLQKYSDSVKALLHPSGFKLFGDVLLSDTLSSDSPFHSEIQKQEISVIGNYTPYTFGTTQDLRANNSVAGTSVDLYPNGFAPGFTGATANGPTIGTVPEGGITAHVVGVTGATAALGTTGAEGYTSAQTLGLNFFSIFHHPNSRGINDIALGTSFGAITTGDFNFLNVGFHFHSNPTYSTWTSPQFPFLGTTGAGAGAHDQYYSVPYGTTSETNNG
tara:strand:+ start:1502 stop:3280 length:1779 start_codon:yes stop_codon:yes gene_type:complete